MIGGDRKDTALMRVSIVAGPALPTLLRDLGATDAARIGVLADTQPLPPTDRLTFFQLSGDNPDRISADIRGIAAGGAIDHLVLQCATDRPPMAYASLFVAGDHVPETVNDVAQLTATWFAIDAGMLADTMLGRPATAPLSPCFNAEQLEFASDIFLAGERDLSLAKGIASTLNPRARITTAGPDLAGHGTAFDFEAALNGAGWRQLLDGHKASAKISEEIVAFAYGARRPFHPGRFWKLLQHDLAGVFRAKGFFWLATRMNEVGGLNLAGSEIHCASAGQWWAARDPQIRESEMPERSRAEWQEPFGDRRQSFALMALNLDEAVLRTQFDNCLLTDDEMTAGPARWHDLPDPFPSWTPHVHAHHHHHHHHHDCDHDHDSEEHDCCHH
jgi:G3E family GTPase